MSYSAQFTSIVFMDDFFRSPENQLHSHPVNRRLLGRVLGLQAQRLGIACRQEFAKGDGGGLDVAAMMDALALPHTADGWACACNADLMPLAKSGLLPEFSPGTLVIGWGLSPSLMHWIDRSGAAFLDIEVDPMRFARNLAFCVRTNDRRIEAALAPCRVDEETLWNEAAVIQGYFARRGCEYLFDRTLKVGLFCGQTCIDLALVRDGTIARPIDAVDEVRALAHTVDVLLIKPHPYEQDMRHLARLAAEVPNAAWTDANIYALLCADNLKFLCGLSSGVLSEAAYFMKYAIPLIQADRNNRAHLPPGCSDWISVGPDILSQASLARICASPVDAAACAPSFPADSLDRIFGIRWGLDAQSDGLETCPPIERGEIHEFHAGRPETAWLGFGWSKPEATGTWTNGRHASLVIPVRPDALPPDTSEWALRFEGRSLARSVPRVPMIRAWIGGRQMELQGLTSGGNSKYLNFDLPIAPRRRADGRAVALVIKFDIAEPQRPCDLGLGGDDRRLGLFLQRLSLVPARDVPGFWRRTVRSSSLRSGMRDTVLAVCAAACWGLLGAALQPTPAQSSSRLAGYARGVTTKLGKVREEFSTLIGHRG